jgi:signal transduction histidine kinase
MIEAPLWRRRPVAIDTALILTAFAIGCGGLIAARTNDSVQSAPFGVAMLVVTAAAAATLWFRRERPIIGLALFVATLLVGGGIHKPGLYSGLTLFVLVVDFYAVVAWGNHRKAGFALVAIAFVLAVPTGARENGWGSAVAFSAAAVLLPAVAGYAARIRRRYLDEVERRLREAERDRDERARRAVADERSRVARELHDVVAHHVSLIGVQAGAARTALEHEAEPHDRTAGALAAIEETSRQAVREMRQLLHVLEPGDGSVELAPQPGLADVPRLVERLRAAGYDVDYTASRCDGVSAALGLSCYRVIEESLTNVTRHSTARHIAVSVAHEGSGLALSVEDPGPPRREPDDPGRGVGRGLLGMKQRVDIFGGALTTGPTGQGGYRVLATFPRANPS